MHYFILLFYFNFITWPHLWNMEILGSESNPSFSCGIARYLNHLPQLGTKSRYRTQASATQDTAVKSLTHCTTAGTPKAPFYFQIPISQFYFILFFIIYIHIFLSLIYIYIFLSFIYIYIYFGGHSMVTQFHIHVYLF